MTCRGLPLVNDSADYPEPFANYWFNRNINDQSTNGRNLVATNANNTGYGRQTALSAQSDLAYDGFGLVQSSTGSRDPQLTRVDTDFALTSSMTFMTCVKHAPLNTTPHLYGAYGGPGETQANNFLWALQTTWITDRIANLTVVWEHGAGVNVVYTTTTLAIMTRIWYVVGFIRTDNGDGTSDVSVFVNDLDPETLAGQTSPDGGTTATLGVLDLPPGAGTSPFWGLCSQWSLWDSALTTAQYYAAVRRMMPRFTQAP